MKLKPILYYPTLADPRFISVVLLLGLDVYALKTPAFSRHFAQLAASVLSWVGTDALLLLFYQRVLLVPLSAFVPSLAAFCLIDSPQVWPYAAVGVVAMLSKHFLRVDGRHIFNPLNFGLVIAFLFFSSHAAFDAARFEDFPMLFLWVAPLGILVAWRCGRLDIALTFVATFLAGAGARAWLSHARLLTVLAPMGSIVFYMFSFHMMTDPKTIPESRAHRLAFGVAVGLLDAVLRYQHVVGAPFYALFCVIGFLPFFRRSEGKVPGSFIWRERALRLGPSVQA